MIKGVLMTLTLAHQIVGVDELELRARIQKASRALLKLDAVSGKSGNRGLAHGLVALWTKDDHHLRMFSSDLLNIVTMIGDISDIDSGFYVGGIADWSGIHLSMISNIAQILLSQELMKVFPSLPHGYMARDALRSAEATLWEMQQTYKNANRDFLTIITYAFSSKAKNDNVFRMEAENALWTLREVPIPRIIGSASVDLRKHAHWSLSAWPHLPWKALAGLRKMKPDLDFNYFAMGSYGYPHFETGIWSTNYLWKDSPFRVGWSSDPRSLPFSSDFLMAYWAARASGLLPAQH
jgi:hypothetical protein